MRYESRAALKAFKPMGEAEPSRRSNLRGSARRALARVLALAVAIGISGCGKGKAGPVYEIEKVYSKGPVEVKLSISKKSISIAERLTLVLQATAGPTTEVEMPKFGEKLEQFGIANSASPPSELLDGGRVRTRRTYTLEPFLSGDYKIPPMTVRFGEKGQSGERHEIATEEFAIKVQSLLPTQVKALDIKDIASPAEMPRRRVWKLVVLSAACAMLLAAAAFVWFKTKKRRREAAKALPAHEIAYAELERLLGEKLVEAGAIKEFYNRVSAILRRYIENRFSLKAPERTTEEFLVEMERNDVLQSSWKAILGKFLAHCDLVKFAEHQPSNADIQGTFDTCKDFIEATREKSAGGNTLDQFAGEAAP